ncbi:MAG: hypothetical protein A3D65_06015 [Candidatus Lloydbacteria bacterium RIFCSPHIGHO2_02_FULL_50_13]|uniref:PDZ domain-containing protein n=1 Tax=Candidatus Lloydbacteria bacterium RIFCSPHIGHO2_02_FULL_50_13 TaxID=1798661 RepID=A0A1G2D1K3_9BACT|nr:MAG: hypothetical protein A3D65_06015 [Candidatus Lloydbacteria bacterium RIFCSPHIGHO2_02_FULL_50_13]
MVFRGICKHGFGVPIFLAVIFVAVAKYQSEETARKEVTSALYEVVLETMKAEASGLSPHYLYRTIPVDARPGFLGYMAAWAKEVVDIADRPIEEFLKLTPQKGIGVNMRVIGLGPSDRNSKSYAYGVLVNCVLAESPASRAGLCEGDQILAIDGEAMNISVPPEETADQMKMLGERAVARLHENDETIILQIARDGKKLTLRISEHNAFDHLRDHEKVVRQRVWDR